MKWIGSQLSAAKIGVAWPNLPPRSEAFKGFKNIRGEKKKKILDLVKMRLILKTPLSKRKGGSAQF